jgi:hypothetical protein
MTAAAMPRRGDRVDLMTVPDWHGAIAWRMPGSPSKAERLDGSQG